mgnify:CR=1 FL=1
MLGLDLPAETTKALTVVRELLLMGSFPGEVAPHVAASLQLLAGMIAASQPDGDTTDGESGDDDQPDVQKKRGRPRKVLPAEAE